MICIFLAMGILKYNFQNFRIGFVKVVWLNSHNFLELCDPGTIHLPAYVLMGHVYSKIIVTYPGQFPDFHFLPYKPRKQIENTDHNSAQVWNAPLERVRFIFYQDQPIW